MKTCSQCNKRRPDTDFFYKNKKLGKRQAHCKKCQRVYGNKHYKTHKQYYVDKAANYQKKSAQAVLEYLLKHPCVHCGEGDVEVLDFDHLYDKKMNVCKMILNGNSVKSIFKEIAKCEVRCANCHRRKTAREQGWYRFVHAPVV